MKDLVEYLTTKVDGININNPKANAGGVLLKLHLTYREDMETLVLIAIQLMQRLFTREASDNPAGTTPLTNMSRKLGQFIYRHIGREPVTWKQELRLGDLFVEAFYNLGYVDITYPRRRDSSHIVEVTHRWGELRSIPTPKMGITITSTEPHQIHKIMGPVQQNGRPVVKDNFSVDNFDLHSPFVRSIDRLQRQGWKINEPVFKALKKAKGFTSSSTEKNKAKNLKRISKLIEWKFINSKAELLLDTEFYQYMSADYRGRIYYDEPFLNYQGSDLARGILLFGKGKVMRQEDTYWLAVHTATSYNQSYDISEIPDWCEADYASHLTEEGLESISVDKMTLNDRAQWTQENIQALITLGKNREFRPEAEKTVTFLACCVELYNYSITDGDYISHLPIPIDGSNNGWQHLGAISKDRKTGELVGLIPTDIQKDFYVQTAKELINQTEDDRLIGILDAMPMKHIRKGISKRGSMTRAYSAGAGKIAENMYFDCKVEDFHETYGIKEEDCSSFAKLLIKAIDIVCPGPLSTMAYFQALAAKEIGYTDRITWTTPSGFDVEYTAWKMDNHRCLGTISGYRRVNHVVHIASDYPDIRSFMCGISPNFIHSLDAAHMSLVVDEWPNTFGAVHDSFSTHACDVEDLLTLTKSKFIEMYDVPNFYDYIAEEIVTDHRDLDVEQPTQGELDIKEIEYSDYFFA